MVNMIELQNKLLDMLKWFHEFCVDNDLTYYLSSGTMLGAARHQGIIPWDDDVDVMMPREDLKRFASLMSEQSGRYILEIPDSPAKEYCYTWPKLFDTETTIIENTKYKTKRGVFLDIFPLDGMGNSQEEAKAHWDKIRRTYKLFNCNVLGISKRTRKLKKLVILLFRLIPMNEKKLLRKIISQCEEKSYESCELCGNPLGGYKWKEIMPKWIYGKPTLYKFSDFEVFGVEHPDEYLTRLYGDWRTPPPEDKRVSEHNFLFIDLNKGYLEN